MNKFQEYCLAKKSDELKKLILENPDLPLVVLCGEEANSDGSYWTFCSSIRFEVEEILDCDYVDFDETVFTDRARLEDVVADRLYEDYGNKTAEEYVAAIGKELERLEPYWKKVIAIYADN